MKHFSPKRWRFVVLLTLLSMLALGLVARLIYLNIVDRHFLLHESNVRILRNITIPAYRGLILSRQGIPLAVSTPVKTLWINPQRFNPSAVALDQLSSDIGLSAAAITHLALSHQRLKFLYIKRKMPPTIAEKVAKLHIPGLHLRPTYKRYYPSGEVDAQLVGFTNINGQGQSGLELVYNQWLSGKSGMKRVIIDRKGGIIADIRMIHPAIQGKNLVLSVDQSIQYLAYRALKEAIARYHAKAGSVVVLNPKTGEVLAMVNQPSFNPNARPPDTDGRYRNRAVTDMYEPGSVIKPFTVALALESGRYTTKTLINTHPGWMSVGGYVIRDDGLDHGVIDLRELLQKSSNVGAAKVMLALQPHRSYMLFSQFGFGRRTASGFPGESAGLLRDRQVWQPSVVAALAYGYGIAVTPLQLAHAYGVLANSGVSVPVTFLKQAHTVLGRQIVSPTIARQVVSMLQSVVAKGGTGTRAAVAHYQVAGKTGTAYIANAHGYNKHAYMASFVGMAPAKDPQLVVAVDIRDPQGEHFGGEVAAPVFSKVMGGALRILNILPVVSSLSSVSPGASS